MGVLSYLMLVVIGALWGVTNPFMKRGAKGIGKRF